MKGVTFMQTKSRTLFDRDLLRNGHERKYKGTEGDLPVFLSRD